jgi:hypothetical protein
MAMRHPTTSPEISSLAGSAFFALNLFFEKQNLYCTIVEEVLYKQIEDSKSLDKNALKTSVDF